MAGRLKELEINLKASFAATEPVIQQLTSGFRSVGIGVDFSGEKDVQVSWHRTKAHSHIIEAKAGDNEIYMKAECDGYLETVVQFGDRRFSTKFGVSGEVKTSNDQKWTPATPEGKQRKENIERLIKDSGKVLFGSFSL